MFKTYIMKNLIIVSSLFFGCSLFGQTNIIQDGDGETSLQTIGNLITFNTADASIGFNFSPSEITNKDKFIWSISGSLGSKEGTTKIFSKGKLNFDGKLGMQIITVADPTNGERGIKHWFFGTELLYTRINVFDSLKVFEEQVYVKNNLGFRVNGGWNKQSTKKRFSYGVALSGGLKDNSDEFDPNDIITTISTITEDNQIRTLSSTESAYDITKLEKNKLFGKVNMDIGNYIGSTKRLFANFHINYAFQQNVKPSFNPAIGLFYTEDGAPLEAVVGVQLQTKDWSNTHDSEYSRWERTSLIITAGFPFN